MVWFLFGGAIFLQLQILVIFWLIRNHRTALERITDKIAPLITKICKQNNNFEISISEELSLLRQEEEQKIKEIKAQLENLEYEVRSYFRNNLLDG